MSVAALDAVRLNVFDDCVGDALGSSKSLSSKSLKKANAPRTLMKYGKNGVSWEKLNNIKRSLTVSAALN